jgi:aspartyl-tRNA(Asn)/glutamyl-tRNA(Gln) amidotransferase subunit C
MAIDRETVRKVAHLARIELDDDEIAHFQTQLAAILDTVDRLKELDVAGVEPLAHPGVEHRLRDDTPAPALPVDAALGNAPAKSGDFFIVPRILE